VDVSSFDKTHRMTSDDMAVANQLVTAFHNEGISRFGGLGGVITRAGDKCKPVTSIHYMDFGYVPCS
jgi:hypothetical protein